MVKDKESVYVDCAIKGRYCLWREFSPCSCPLIAEKINSGTPEIQCIVFDINLLDNGANVRYYGFNKIKKYKI